MKFGGAKRVKTPFSKELCASLKAGDWILLSGKIYTARDQAHKKMLKAIAQNQNLPLSLQGQVIYYLSLIHISEPTRPY